MGDGVGSRGEVLVIALVFFVREAFSQAALSPVLVRCVSARRVNRFYILTKITRPASRLPLHICKRFLPASPVVNFANPLKKRSKHLSILCL